MSLNLVSKTAQRIKKDIFGAGWIHLGTAEYPPMNIGGTAYPERTFMLLQREKTGDVYIEEFDRFGCRFLQIKDDKLWNELYLFFYDNGLIISGVDKTWEADEAYTQSLKAQSKE